MLFHTFRVVYTVKELDSHAKYGESFKKQFGRNLEKSYFWVRTSFGEFFFDRGSCWRKRGWNSLYGHFSQKSAPVHTSTRARARASLGCTARDSLGKNVSKEVCFWLWGKDNLVQLPEEPSVTWTVDAVCFFGAATEFLVCLLTNVL